MKSVFITSVPTNSKEMQVRLIFLSNGVLFMIEPMNAKINSVFINAKLVIQVYQNSNS